ncbi:MAG: 5'/3'-nucleotidase SurE [Bacteroidales bacterium]|nr:5'/3'-nucleotidase SurE [Bacteroidales bacterium]
MADPTILVTNDDGIHAPGLRKLISIAREFGRVAVVAPDGPRSGMSHAITSGTPLRLKKLAEDNDYSEYVCTGTPVDAIKMGEQIVLKKRPDLVLSGINHGSNASVNIIYSGTMGAALEACIDGIPAIGFSILDYSSGADFSAVDDYVRIIIRNTLEHGLPEHTCLNVNIPAINREAIRGIKVCKQAKGKWEEEFDVRIDPHNHHYYWLTGAFRDGDTSPDSDSFALANNFISIVPVHFDFTAHHAVNDIRKWDFNV